MTIQKYFFKYVVIEKTIIYILLNERIENKDHALIKPIILPQHLKTNFFKSEINCEIHLNQ